MSRIHTSDAVPTAYGVGAAGETATSEGVKRKSVFGIAAHTQPSDPSTPTTSIRDRGLRPTFFLPQQETRGPYPAIYPETRMLTSREG